MTPRRESEATGGADNPARCILVVISIAAEFAIIESDNVPREGQ